jgi:hypothetical protein
MVSPQWFELMAVPLERPFGSCWTSSSHCGGADKNLELGFNVRESGGRMAFERLRRTRYIEMKVMEARKVTTFTFAVSFYSIPHREGTAGRKKNGISRDTTLSGVSGTRIGLSVHRVLNIHQNQLRRDDQVI